MLTDSGGIQEETTYLGIPCFTLRDNTERPVTISAGTNTLLGLDPAGDRPSIPGPSQPRAAAPSEPPSPLGRPAASESPTSSSPRRAGSAYSSLRRSLPASLLGASSMLMLRPSCSGVGLDHGEPVEVLEEPLQQRPAALGVGLLAAAEHDRDLDLVVVLEEALDVALLGLVVVVRDLRPQLDFADVDLRSGACAPASASAPARTCTSSSRAGG